MYIYVQSAGVAMAMLPNGNQLQVLPSHPSKKPDQQGGQKINSSVPTNPPGPNLPLPNSAKDNKNSSLIKVFISLSLSLSLISYFLDNG